MSIEKILLIVILQVLFFTRCRENRESEDRTIIKVIQLQEKASNSFDSDSALFYYKKSIQIAKKSSMIPDSIVANSYHLLGDYFNNMDEIDSAAYYYFNTLEYLQKPLTKKQRSYYYDTWYAFKRLGKFGDCFAINKKFRSVIDSANNFQSMGWYFFFEENTYKAINEYSTALVNNKKRTRWMLKARDTAGLIRAFLSRAVLLSYIKNNKLAIQITDSILKQEKSLHLTNDQKRQLYGNLGMFLFFEKDYTGAIQNYKKGLFFLQKVKNDESFKSKVANHYINIAEAEIRLNHYKKAEAYLDSVQQLGIDKIDKRLVKSFLKYKIELLYKTSEEISSVINFIDTISGFQEKLYQEKFNKEILALTKAKEKQNKIALEKKHIEIQSLRFKNYLIILGALFLILLLFGFLYFKQRKLFFEKQNLIMQQKLLRSQMNPHFTFNTLYAIKNILQKKPEIASSYLITFSRLLRLVFENSAKDFVSLEDELESIEKYLDLQLIRFPDRFIYSINIVDFEDEEYCHIPPMLIQPFVENSILHGFSTITYQGKITIELTKKEKLIKCVIDDNGSGLSSPVKKKEKQSSVDLISIYLEKMTGEKITMINKKSLTNATGTKVIFYIPFKKY